MVAINKYNRIQINSGNKRFNDELRRVMKAGKFSNERRTRNPHRRAIDRSKRTPQWKKKTKITTITINKEKKRK